MQYEDSQVILLAASWLEIFTYSMLISKMLKNAALNYSCSLGLFLLLLGTVFLNSVTKASLKGGAFQSPLARKIQHLSHAKLKGNGNLQKEPKSTWSLSPLPQQFYSYVWVFLNVIMW